MIHIGVLATLDGPYRFLGEDAIRGLTIALQESNNEIAGQPIKLTVESTNAMAASATHACQKLIDEIGVDIIVGPLSGDEGVAVREFAREHPERVFLNGAAGSQQIYNPAPNFFSFSPNGVQFIAGLGTHCYEQGYRRIVTLSEAYSYTFAQIGGFALEFCKAGGEIVEILWCGLGTENYTPFIEQIPDDVDAVCSVLGGTDSVRFVQQYREARGNIPIIGGTLQGDATSLHFSKDYADLLEGMLTASPVCDDAPDDNWRSFVQTYTELYADDGFYSPSLIAFGYYMNLKSLLMALAEIDGNLDDGQEKLKQTLLSLEFDGLTGRVKLDRHHFPVIDNFVNKVAVKPDGTLYTTMVKRIEKIDSTLGYTDEEWLAMGKFDMSNIPCGRFTGKRETFADIIKRTKKS